MSDVDSALARLSLEVEKPARMPLLHYQTLQPLRDATGKEAWIDLYSSDSEIKRRHDRETQRRRLNTNRVGRIRVTPEELEAEGTDLLVSLTAGWFLLDLDGFPIELPFTPENARRIYDGIVWIREQVDQFCADRANFTPASLQISSNGQKPSLEVPAKR
jgi:hypothetical protein